MARESDDQTQTEGCEFGEQGSGGAGTVVRFRVDGREERDTEEERYRYDGAARRRQTLHLLDALQVQTDVREVALRPAADQPRAQSGLP